jgi:hypothetical protein
MRPNAEELLRGAQASLMTYVLPEVQTEYARAEAMLVIALLGIVSAQCDGAAQTLVDDNAALRSLALRGAEALAGRAEHAELIDALGSLAAGAETSLRISELAAANAQLRAALARLGVTTQDRDDASLRELRTAILAYLRDEAERRGFALLGPRADG